MPLELHQGEHVIFDGHPSWRGTLSFYAKGLVVSAIGFSLGLVIVVFVVLMAIVILAGFLFRLTTTYTITNQRLTIQRGILSKHMQQTRVERVQNVNTDQTLLDRILRVGRVDFDTAGSDGSEFAFLGVANPERVVRAVDKAHRESERYREARPGEGL
jgi:uncharacterized membrane protein YdbT with pleckstrin-like domain